MFNSVLVKDGLDKRDWMDYAVAQCTARESPAGAELDGGCEIDNSSLLDAAAPYLLYANAGAVARALDKGA